MKHRHQSAFSLVEVTVALGIGAFCLIAIFGLIPIGTTTNRNAAAESTATSILSAITADLRSTPTSSNASPRYNINFGSSATVYFDAAGNPTATANDQVYRLTIGFPTTSAYATFVRFQISWPAAVDPSTGTPSGSVEAFAALDRH